MLNFFVENFVLQIYFQKTLFCFECVKNIDKIEFTRKLKKYIEQHAQLARNLNKPLVIEEFGLHRDGNSFDPSATVNNRNKYYDFVFKTGKENGVSGYNFWGFAGVPSNYNPKGFMQKVMPYSADPPQEEKVLYSVFMTDSIIWKTIQARR